ncbi:lysostaphin resistance A-like protein [Paraglaciecola sp.]|uniref:CPBP family intramembrane glutamic endopeptidase n=1 Tax=Paraglaciecola sp. TaxID=1920173 RepID=UPI003EF90A39
MVETKLRIVIKAFSIWLIFQGLFFTFGALGGVVPKWALAIVFGGFLSTLMLYITSLYLKNDILTKTELGLSFSISSLKRGTLSFIIGIVFFAFFYLCYFGLTPIIVLHVEQPDFVNSIIISLFSFIALGAMEEIVFRGYFMRKLDTAIGIRASIYVTSIAFGLYHGFVFDSITGPAVWGLVYAVLAYWTKGLAIPIGFHIGVNYLQALFSQKEKWVSGIWYFDLQEGAAIFTVEQVSIGLKLFMLLLGIALVEYYLRKVRHATIKTTQLA